MSAPMTTDQDVRKLRSTKFPPEFDVKVDMSKVNVPVIKKWVSDETARILGFDDDILTEMVFGFIDDTSQPDIKMLQIQLSGFLNEQTPQFCLALWKMCISAQESPQGIPKQLLEAKKMELINEKIQEDKARAEAKERQESMRQRDDELSNIRTRERAERNERNERNGRNQGYRRDDRGYTRESFRRASRSPSPARRRRNGDSYYRDPPRRGVDSYVPNRGGRDESRRRTRRRSPTTSRSPSPPPQRRHRPRPTSPSRSRSRTPPRRRRRRSSSRTSHSRSPSPRRRRRSPSSTSSRSPSRSRSPTPPRHRRRKRPHSPSRSRSRSRLPARSRSRDHGSHRKSRRGRHDGRKNRSRSPARYRRRGSPSPQRSRRDSSARRNHGNHRRRGKYSRSRSPSLKRRRRRSNSSSSVDSRPRTRDLIASKDSAQDKARLSREPSEQDENVSESRPSRSSSATAE